MYILPPPPSELIPSEIYSISLLPLMIALLNLLTSLSILCKIGNSLRYSMDYLTFYYLSLLSSLF